MKRTTVMLDEHLIAEAKRLTGIATTQRLIEYALRELVRRCSQRQLLGLRGRVDWQGDLDAWRRDRDE